MGGGGKRRECVTEPERCGGRCCTVPCRPWPTSYRPDPTVSHPRPRPAYVTTSCRQGPERIESVKAATVAATAGLLAELPLITLTAGGDTPALSSALSLLAAMAACFLFGVTYR